MSINPYEPPQTSLEPVILPSESDARIVRDGKELVVPVDATLPARCAKCNRPASSWGSVYLRSTESVSFSMAAAVITFSIFGFVFAFTIIDGEWLPEPLREYSGLLVMVPSLAVVGLVSLYHRRNAMPCRFGICPFHHRARYASHVFYAILILYFVLNLIRLDLDNPPWWLDWESPIHIFWVFILASFAASFMQINVHVKRDGEHYRVSGCGKAFLGSFPDDT